MAIDRFLVESGHIMQFSRAVGETDDRFMGALHGQRDGVPAPPTFVAAGSHYDPDWTLRPKPGEKWAGSGKDDGSPLGGSEDGGTGLHAEQHYEYHRPLASGMVLTARTRSGEEWTKEGRRGGALQFSETITEYVDEDGELVVTVRSVGVRTTRVVG